MAFEGVKRFFRRIGGMFTGNFMQTLPQVVNEENIMSQEMLNNIELWMNMFDDNAPWLSHTVQSAGIPSKIASDISRKVTLEMAITIDGGAMAKYLDEQFEDIRKHLRINVEYACAGGGLIFKPYINGDKINVEIVHANMFLPTSYNAGQEITGAYFIYRHWEGKIVYTRLEKHSFEEDGRYHIENTCYESMNFESIGSPCPMTEVPEWADIDQDVYLMNIEKPLFAYFKMPIGNQIDKSSPLGASIYSKAVPRIKEADKQYSRVLWEYEGGELAIEASNDAFRHVNGLPLLPEGKERLYRVNNIDTAVSGGSFMTPWNPTLRDTNLWNGFNKLLMEIEDDCSLTRGSLSEPNDVARTATEIINTKQQSYALIHDIQESLSDALTDLVDAMHALAILYELSPDSNYELNITFDDAIVIDAEAERLRDQQEVREGLMMKYEYRMKWYHEDEATARQKVKELEGMTDDEILGFEKPEERKQKKENEDIEEEE